MKKFTETAVSLLAVTSVASQESEVSLRLARHLKITQSSSSARACRSNCLDQGQFFCASQDFSAGVCCDTADETCR